MHRPPFKWLFIEVHLAVHRSSLAVHRSSFQVAVHRSSKLTYSEAFSSLESGYKVKRFEQLRVENKSKARWVFMINRVKSVSTFY